MSGGEPVLVDSGIWIDYFKFDPSSGPFRRLQDAGRAVLLSLVAYEVLNGVRDAAPLPRVTRCFRGATWVEAGLRDLTDAASARNAVADGPSRRRRTGGRRRRLWMRRL